MDERNNGSKCVGDARAQEILEKCKEMVPAVLSLPMCHCPACIAMAALQMGWQMGELEAEDRKAAVAELNRIAGLSEPISTPHPPETCTQTHNNGVEATENPSKPNCPKCGHSLEKQSGPGRPKADDLSICAGCGVILVFDPDLKLRSVTDGELANIPTDLLGRISAVSARIVEARRNGR